MDNDKALTIDCTPAGSNGTVTLTAKLGDDVLAVEAMNLAKPEAREGFLDRLCEGRPGIDRDALEKELLRMAAETVERNGEQLAEENSLEEIDVSRIVRPERFITPDVSGIAVPTMTVIDDTPVGQWLLYLRWAEWLRAGTAPNPAELFQRLYQRIAYFIDLPKEHAQGTTATLALWTILTYSYLAWDAMPYLFFAGPLASGKSRVLEIVSRLVLRPLLSSNMTGAALFRTLHSQGGTLLFDEAERLKETNSPEVRELLSMLLAGYKRGGQATRLERFGDSFRAVYFDVYGPKAMACIAGLPLALASRCISMMMFRASPGSEKPRRRIDDDLAGWQSLRDDLHAPAMENGEAMLKLPKREDVCPSMSGRDYELWQPLLTLAWWVESHEAKGLLKLMRQHAMKVIDSGKDEQTPDHDEALLRILADFVRSGRAPQPKKIAEKAKELEPEIFRRWSPKAVSSHLKRYGLQTNKTGGRKVYGRVTLADLLRVQQNYSLDLDLSDESGGT